MSGEARRKYEVLMLVIEDADKSKSSDERQRLLREFMAKSAEFLELAPTQTNIWVVRGAAAVEVDYPGAGWLVGRKLKELRLQDSSEAAVRKVMAALERKGWLGKEGLFRDWSKWTMEQVKAAALEGDTEAQMALGDWHRRGVSGLTKDEAEAVKWYRKAADAGNAVAQNSLGIMYDNGDGVPKDEADAVKWYRKAADAGNASAQYNLGFNYANGQGVPKDEAEAVRWCRKAADAGLADAQINLGLMYANGQGVPKDEAEAVKWYRKAADAGNAVAQGNLGVMYANGLGVPKDEAEAVKWYRKAAEQGNADAKAALQTLQAKVGK